MRIAHHENYTYVYTQGKNIAGVYPEGEIPGFTADESKKTRESNGGNLSRYKFMAISLGDRQELKGMENEMRAAAQTAIHETMHSVIDTLKTKKLITEEELNEIYKLVATLSIQNNQAMSAVITTNSFAEILNPASHFYKGYNDAQKPEEVICNLYSLLHTEPNKENSPLNTPEITQLMGAIESLVQRLTKKLATPKEATQNVGLIGVRKIIEGTDTSKPR